MIYLILLLLVSYLLGGFSFAGLIAKVFKNINLRKVGKGYPDTENLYYNVSKWLGVLAGLSNVTKMYVYVFFMHKLVIFLGPKIQLNLSDTHIVFLLGYAFLVGHCLPVANYFKGGRGSFSYIGFVAYFSLIPMIGVAIFGAIFAFCFRQVRFSQYWIVIIPPVFIQIFSAFWPDLAFYPHANPGPMFVTQMLIAALVMGIINVVLAKRLGEI